MQDFGGSWGTGTAVWLRHVHTIDHAMRINESDHHRLAHSFLRQALLLGLDAIHPTELVLMPTWSEVRAISTPPPDLLPRGVLLECPLL